MATGLPVAPGELVECADYLNRVSLARWRKTTSKQVVNTVSEADLLNGEITIGAGCMMTDRGLYLKAWGDGVNNTGATVTSPRFKLKLGSATLLDTDALANAFTTSATRRSWRIEAEILNTAASSQWASLKGGAFIPVPTANATGFATGEGAAVVFPITGSLGKFEFLGEAAATVDTTIANLLQLTVTLATANASHDVTLKGAIVELV